MTEHTIVANYVTGVNPQILKWAREKAGYSIEDIAISFKKDVGVISNWETGEEVPTYNQLEKLAYSLYKRPIALFFFPSPPDEPDPGKSFRTLPDIEIENLYPDTLIAIREAQAMQITLNELSDGINLSEAKIFQDIRISSNANPKEVASKVRELLGIPLQEQIKWKNITNALRNWRNVVEANGIFIFKRSFKQGDISGFCITDDQFPVIYLNNSTTKSRQIFSIFHELAHILLGTSGITKISETYIGYLTGKARSVEIFCNHFAGEFLVPSGDFDLNLNLDLPIERTINKLSRRYSVSREVILRKLHDRNLISSTDYQNFVDQWLSDYEAIKSSKGRGGNYYATQATYFGEKFLNLVFSKYYSGNLSIQQVADYMNIKAKSVAGIEQFVP